MPGGPTLVTGATGFAGGYLLERLARTAGAAPLVGLARPGGRAPRPDTAGVRWDSADLLDPAAVDGLVAALRPRAIYHLAGAPHVGQSFHDALRPLELHVRATHHLLDAVRRHAPEARVLVVSSAMIYRPADAPVDEDAPLGPASPYGLSKLAQDQLALDVARQDHLDVVVARPFNHAGPRQEPSFALSGFARQIAAAELGQAPPELRVGNLDARRDLTDVRDVVDAYAGLLRQGRAGRPYNVCSRAAYRIGDLLEQLAAMAMVRVRPVVDQSRLRPADQPLLVGDNTRIRTEVGWSPSIPIETLLADTLAWWRDALRHGVL
jgi:GDP-4-dehydro-6-deoxy-D-mannose reductase